MRVTGAHWARGERRVCAHDPIRHPTTSDVLGDAPKVPGWIAERRVDAVVALHRLLLELHPARGQGLVVAPAVIGGEDAPLIALEATSSSTWRAASSLMNSAPGTARFSAAPSDPCGATTTRLQVGSRMSYRTSKPELGRVEVERFIQSWTARRAHARDAVGRDSRRRAAGAAGCAIDPAAGATLPAGPPLSSPTCRTVKER
jgi:hypothetical protein